MNIPNLSLKKENKRKASQTASARGFTLIEIMVAVAIFSVVMLVSAGSMFSILDANAKSQALKSVMNNLNLAIESISRNIRVGSTYHCGNSGVITETLDCVGGNTYFAFEETGGDGENSSDQVVYRLSGNQIEKSTNSGSTFIGITSPEVVIEDLTFYVDGSSSSDEKQPRVLIIVRGYAGIKDKIRSDFNIQTGSSQRLLDVSI